MRVLKEVKRRKVAAVIAWYTLGAWALIQVADVIGPALSFPAATIRYLIYAALAGLPIVVTLAWIFDFSPTGIQRTPRLEKKHLADGAPRSPAAYELYLRANHIATQSGQWDKAIAVYRDCLALDPKFAAGWARLARCYRLLGKFTTGAESEANLRQARAAFERALSLQPDLSLAHSLYAQLEIDTGKPEEAMVRLLARAEIGAADAEIYVGLVQACRFVGLLEESVASYEKARALDANARTGIAHTYFMLGQYEKALREYKNADIGYLEGLALAMLDRKAEAIALLRTREDTETLAGPYIASLRAVLEDRREEAIALIEQTTTASLARDGEAVFYMARQYAHLGEHERAVDFLHRAIKQGFVCSPCMMTDPWLDQLRDNTTFKGLLRAAETRHMQAAETFATANGRRILSM